MTLQLSKWWVETVHAMYVSIALLWRAARLFCVRPKSFARPCGPSSSGVPPAGSASSARSIARSISDLASATV
eukprot:4352305-Prymnesium_polylepis.1